MEEKVTLFNVKNSTWTKLEAPATLSFFAEETSANPSLVTWLHRLQNSFTGRPDSQGSAIGLRTPTGFTIGPPSVPRSLTHWETLTSPLPVLTSPIRLPRKGLLPGWSPLMSPALASSNQCPGNLPPNSSHSYSGLLRSPVDRYLVLELRNCLLAQASPWQLPRLASSRLSLSRLLITDFQYWVFNTDSPRLTLLDWKTNRSKKVPQLAQKTDCVWYRSSPNLLSLTG